MIDIREALEDMVFQFGYRGTKNGKPMIWTGGLSALEGAFDALDWDDPHYLPEQGYTCEIDGCMEADTVGTPWANKGETNPPYLRLCPIHASLCFKGEPRPKVKQYALDREARRDPVTRVLNPENTQ